MSVLTLKHSRKVAAQKRQAAELQQAQQERLQRACKGMILSGPATTAQEIAALDLYIERLGEIRADMLANYGGLLHDRDLGWIDLEVSQSVEQIIKLRINDARPQPQRRK